MKIPYSNLQKLALLALLAISGKAFATTTVSGTSGDWYSVTWDNGTPAGTPVLGVNVTTAGNAAITTSTLTLATTATTNNLTMTASKLTVSGTLVSTGLNEASPVGKIYITGTSELLVQSGATLSVGTVLQSDSNSVITIAAGGTATWSNIAANQSVVINSSTMNVYGTLANTTGGWKGNQVIQVSGGSLLNIDGGRVTANTLRVGNNVGVANTVVKNGGSITILQSTANPTDGISVGYYTNANGHIYNPNNATLTLQDGTITNSGSGRLYIAERAGNAATAGTSTLNVSGGTFTQTASTYIGLGRVGILNISSTGTLTSAGDIYVGGTGNARNVAPNAGVAAKGVINVSGGSLTAANVKVGDGSLVSLGGSNPAWNPAGELHITGGNVSVNSLTATNGANSLVTLMGGTLSTKETTISNGSLFSVGDGTTATTLILNGGSHSFANGIALNNNVTLKGTGTITAGALTANAGSTLSPGNSPGALTLASTTLEGGANYNWQILDATGAAGTGYDTIALNAGAVLTLANTAENKFAINLWSLGAINPDVNGDALNFDNTVNHTWTLIATDQVINNFSADNFMVNVSANNGAGGFTNNLGTGTFSVALADNNTDLVLNFTTVPEPSTWAMIAGGMGMLAFGQRLRRRSA